jgi:glutathione S-transferase
MEAEPPSQLGAPPREVHLRSQEAPMQPIQLHYWPTPNGWKVTIALEEMELPYELHEVNIGAGEQFQPEFLAISPNNRMPAIVDPESGDGAPISVFESGAILQYLARKSGKFFGSTERARVDAGQWLFWQMGGLGPMCGQAHHFRGYAAGIVSDQRMLAYGVGRYTNEVARLYGVLNRRLADREFVAGEYTIADMAIWPWIVPHKMQGVDLETYPDLKRWFYAVGARPAVQKGFKVGEELRKPLPSSGPEAEKARRLLFGSGQRR